MSDHRSKPQRIGDTLYPSCPTTGKIRHPSEQAARDHQAALLTSRGDRVTVFRCRSCSGYHVGHRARNSGKKGRRG